ncbi:NUDIX hydrolase [Ramlibacter sp. H39-3-26]|uniref:NUDIX domain-containing protein n=1 Tax=Curvibacter soli TaxID=3031331 RepID=UPI0023DAD4E5|nr:NUDIX hydrolase [Ramlibacter sp. H39-3-26]MDF1483973.1 NUDIX hydrolase [Ramlibacter sp. H39-3-26]
MVGDDGLPCDDDALIERRLRRERVFSGSFLHVLRDTVRLPDGGTATREFIEHPGAVVVVPLLDDGRVLLERQYRHPIGQVMVEFPAGKLDAGEDPLACGQRELREETGYTAREWACAGAMHPMIAYSTEVIHLYFARGLHAGERHLDSGEFLAICATTTAELLAWARDGRVTDSKTLACLLWLQNVQAGQWALDWREAPP